MNKQRTERCLQSEELGARTKGSTEQGFVFGKPKHVTMDVFPSSFFLVISSFLILRIPFKIKNKFS